MRLIDADELKTAFPCGESVRTECVRATIDHMPSIEPEPHWIPCSERMPDVGAILISDGNQVFIGAYYGNSIWSADGCDYDPILEDIAWMPLPKPYGGEQE